MNCYIDSNYVIPLTLICKYQQEIIFVISVTHVMNVAHEWKFYTIKQISILGCYRDYKLYMISILRCYRDYKLYMISILIVLELKYFMFHTDSEDKVVSNYNTD